MDELTPTENSKVIPIRIDPFTTSDRSGLIKTNKKFYTTDTDAWLHFEIAGMSSSVGEYSLALTNRSDGSVFQRRGELEANEFYYKLNTEESDQNEVKHAGKWIGQVYVTLANGNSTAARFEFSIEGHLLDGREARVIIIQDFNTLMTQLNDLKDELNVDVTALKEKFEKNNADAEDLLEQLGDMIQQDVVSLKVQERYEDLEAEYAQKLTDVTRQLAHIAHDVSKYIIDNDRTGVLEAINSAYDGDTIFSPVVELLMKLV